MWLAVSIKRSQTWKCRLNEAIFISISGSSRVLHISAFFFFFLIVFIVNWVFTELCLRVF